MAALLVGIYALATWRRRRGVAIWASGYCSLFCGMVLISLRGLIPDSISIVIGNPLLLGFLLLVLAGIRQYLGLAVPWRLMALAVALVAAESLYFTIARPFAFLRLVFFDLAVMAISLLGAAAIGRKPSPGVRVISRSIAALLLGIAAAYLARLVMTLRAGLSVDLMSLGSGEVAIQLLSGVMATGLALALILLHSSILTEELAAAARDRALLVREIAHRTKNDLALVDSLISIDQASTAERDPTGGARLGALRDRIRCLAQAHDRLSRSEDSGIVRLDEYLEVIAEALPGRRELSLVRDFARVEAPFSYAAPLGLVMNELATNAIKYAFPEGRAGTIAIALRRAASPGAASERIELEVRDDGVGTSWPPVRQGLGTMIVKSFAEKIGASIAYAFEGGSVFTLGFELPPRSGGS